MRSDDVVGAQSSWDRAIAFAGALLAAVIFGGNFVVARHGVNVGLEPADIVALRYAMAGIVFAPVLLRKGIWNLGGLGWARGAVIASLIGAPYAYCLMLGLQMAPAVHGVVLHPGLTTVFGVLLSWLALGERLGRGAAIGIPTAFVGLILLAGKEFWVGGSLVWVGDLLFAITAVWYGVFGVLMRRWQVPSVLSVAIICVLSAIMWLPGYAIFGRPQHLLEVPLKEIVFQAVYQGALQNGLAVFLFAQAISVIGPSRTVLFASLVPLFGTLLATALLGEELSILQGIGVVGVCVGLLLTLVTSPHNSKSGSSNRGLRAGLH
jgi:drug/metabolite transporter (DMT)-like permease